MQTPSRKRLFLSSGSLGSTDEALSPCCPSLVFLPRFNPGPERWFPPGARSALSWPRPPQGLGFTPGPHSQSCSRHTPGLLPGLERAHGPGLVLWARLGFALGHPHPWECGSASCGVPSPLGTNRARRGHCATPCPSSPEHTEWCVRMVLEYPR